MLHSSSHTQCSSMAHGRKPAWRPTVSRSDYHISSELREQHQILLTSWVSPSVPILTLRAAAGAPSPASWEAAGGGLESQTSEIPSRCWACLLSCAKAKWPVEVYHITGSTWVLLSQVFEYMWPKEPLKKHTNPPKKKYRLVQRQQLKGSSGSRAGVER